MPTKRKKKPAKKKKAAKKDGSKYLGSGMAKRTAKTIKSRRSRLDAALKAAGG